jgi:hypothetical protein
MIRTVLLAALVTLAAVPLAVATSGGPICVFGDGGICAGAWSSNAGTCAGVGFGLQGAGACTNNASPLCAFVFVGFNRFGACSLGELP